MADYHLCNGIDTASVLVPVVAVPGGGMACPSGTTVVTAAWCADSRDICTDFVTADSFIVANVYPSAAEGAELYAWGFALVLGPVLVAQIGVWIIRAIRAVTP